MTTEELLKRWHRSICQHQLEHELASRFYEKLNWKLGVPVVILSAVVGASIFATLKNSDWLWLNITAGFLSVLSVVLASLQTFLGFGDRASGHKTAADRFGELSKELQQVNACGVADGDLHAFIDSIRSRWDAIAREAPTLRKSTIEALAQDPEGVDPVDRRKLEAVA
ncbi:SLATT domain-containing protein [Pseudomonas entomophila]|uniref:SLATT domain-containing protein n=1 Tax=Pseudomonas entomophila TaxID=312306 RepID=UPI0023D8398A|nr:SLATT domain-containing protein [Pseudomonas entomophila]MDF0729540.1 SLATT domain-containing protein [Pseudomonas entomophila]